MEFVVVSGFGLEPQQLPGELAALLGVAVFVLNRKRKQLQSQLQTLASETPPTFDSIASGYLPYLEKQILESRDQLEASEGETEPDNT